ncbi:MAG: integral rane protein [Actinomycetia bacterium]|nr:integral rane protein [Actinomycetes bacterium]
MRDPASRVPWWGVASSALAPILLVGGWTVAAAQQPPGYDPVVRSISSLAAADAHSRWIMTLALALVGACHLTTAAALAGSAPRRARGVLAAGGATTGLVAAFPLGTGADSVHALVASVAFLSLAVWPALLGDRIDLAAAAILVALVVWFGAELYGGGHRVGLAERAAAGAQSLWPLAVVLRLRSSRQRTAAGSP